MSFDSYTAKVEMANNANPPTSDQDNPIVSAQPAVYSSHAAAVGTVANAPPQQAQQAGTLHQPIQPNAQIRARPPPNRWADSICDWPSNLFPSCWCVCCCYCGMWLVAQMAQKTGCCKFTTVLWVSVGVWIVTFTLEVALNRGFMIWLPIVYSLIFSIMLRLHIVKQNNITECGTYPYPAMLGECCCGFWCWYCSVAQMARHLYGYSKVLDGDSDPDRPDNYGPQLDV